MLNFDNREEARQGSMTMRLCHLELAGGRQLSADTHRSAEKHSTFNLYYLLRYEKHSVLLLYQFSNKDKWQIVRLF